MSVSYQDLPNQTANSIPNEAISHPYKLGYAQHSDLGCSEWNARMPLLRCCLVLRLAKA